MKQEYIVTVHDEGTDGLWAEVDDFPGCFATGDTLPELMEAVGEALSLYLSTPDHHAEVRVTKWEPVEHVEQHRVLMEAVS